MEKVDEKPRKIRAGFNGKIKKYTPKIVQELALGIKQDQIARKYEVSQKTVSRINQEFSQIFELLPKIEDYQEVRDKLLTATEFNALRSVNNKDKLEKASLIQVASTFEKIYKCRRLEQGLSTDNQSIKQSTIKITQKS